jgi:hypothetical protein
VTQVYIARTGAKYHAREDCRSFSDAERQHGRRIERRAVPLSGLEREPCAVCWPETSTYDSWTQLSHLVERQGDSIYEAIFVDQVLRRVSGLRPDDVMIQRPAEGRSGKTYRLDFVVETASGERIAVEIDGTDKTLGRTPVEEIRRQVEGKRADLVRAGWRVLNFSNDRVATRSEDCVAELEAAVVSHVRPRPVAPALAPRQPDHVREATARGTSARDGSLTRSSQPPERTIKRSAVPIIALAVVSTLVVGGGAFWVLSQQESSEGSYTPQGQSCPGDAPVKGNINDAAEKIYHEPGWRYYDATWPEACFSSALDAEDEGYRPSEVR